METTMHRVEFDGKSHQVKELEPSRSACPLGFDGVDDCLCDGPERYKHHIIDLDVVIEKDRNGHGDLGAMFRCSKCGPVELSEDGTYRTPDPEESGQRPFIHTCEHIGILEEGEWYDVD